jgi:hypothetical protein
VEEHQLVIQQQTPHFASSPSQDLQTNSRGQGPTNIQALNSAHTFLGTIRPFKCLTLNRGPLSKQKRSNCRRRITSRAPITRWFHERQEASNSKQPASNPLVFCLTWKLSAQYRGRARLVPVRQSQGVWQTKKILDQTKKLRGLHPKPSSSCTDLLSEANFDSRTTQEKIDCKQRSIGIEGV